MADYLEHSRRWQNHPQPRRSVDFTRPGFQRPPDPSPDPLACCPHCEHPPGRSETHVWPCTDCHDSPIDPEAPDAA